MVLGGEERLWTVILQDWKKTLQSNDNNPTAQALVDLREIKKKSVFWYFENEIKILALLLDYNEL